MPALVSASRRAGKRRPPGEFGDPAALPLSVDLPACDPDRARRSYQPREAPVALRVAVGTGFDPAREGVILALKVGVGRNTANFGNGNRQPMVERTLPCGSP